MTAMAGNLHFREGETTVDEALGYPRAYAKLCSSSNIYSRGPPHDFHPYALPPHETARSEEFDRMFPVVDRERKSTSDPEPYVDLLWKQLSHLQNAGFDPALFRVDPYGNVLYLHADPLSPLSWRVDHWFPRKRGGITVPSNLRLVQWQVYKAKKNKLEFLVPWWDLQLGISVNQFLSIFASRNSDFRNRAFSFLFNESEDEVMSELKITETQRFLEKKHQIGLAPAAISSSRKYSDGSVLKCLSPRRQNRAPWPSPSRGDGEVFGKPTQRSRPRISKENEDPNICSGEYHSIAMARDSLRKMEEAKRKRAAMKGLDEEMKDLIGKNDAERLAVQDLEVALIRKRRRVEKCRRLAEAQASYRSQLETMIRNAMHQFVVYKEHARLNQAACSALVARLEAQKAMCDTSEKELLRRFKVREELEMQTAPPFLDEPQQQGRKRSWEEDEQVKEEEGEEEEDCCLSRKLVEMGNDGRGEESIGLSYSSKRKMRKALRKELRIFLEEEQKASEAGISLDEDLFMERSSSSADGDAQNGGGEERMSELGKRNVEKWLQILLEKAENHQGSPPFLPPPPEPEKPSLQTVRFTPNREKEEREGSVEERIKSLPEKRRVERRVMISRPSSPQSSRASFLSSPLILKKSIEGMFKKTTK